MSVRIKLAESAVEIDALFQTRHRVFLSEAGLPPRPDQRVYDNFDAFPDVANVIAVEDGRVVGGVRFVASSPAGSPLDAWFDFSKFLPENARAGTGSLLCVDSAWQNVRGLVVSMMGIGFHWCISRGLTHVLGVAPEGAEAVYERTGHRPLPAQYNERLGAYVPMIMSLSELPEPFASFVRRQEAVAGLDTFVREYYRPGEVVIQRGEVGESCYQIVDGEVAVCLPDSEAPDGRKVVSTLGRGALFGELALLTDRPRTADIIATRDLDLMVLDRATFSARLSKDPGLAARLLPVVGLRLADAMEQLHG